MADTLVLRGTMRGHTDVVTAIAAPIDNSDMVVSSSRDKSVLVWHLTKDASAGDGTGGGSSYGVPRRRLTGHSHFVQDVVLSSDGQFALSGSWDGDLRLWDLSTGHTTRRFCGHTKDVLSVAFSIDNRQIVSASRDRTIKLWNTLGECKYTIQDADAHTNWVSSVRFSPNAFQPTIVSGSWDRTVKVWNLTNCKLRSTLAGHTGYVNTVAVSPDGSLCASGGKDGVTLLWDLSEGKRLYSLDAGAIIHALCFSPNRYWLCAATQESVKIWDLESKSVVQDLKPETTATKNQMNVWKDEGHGQAMLAMGTGCGGGIINQDHAGSKVPNYPTPGEIEFLPRSVKMLYCTSLTWSADGSTLFTGYTDGTIRVWEIRY